MEEHHREANRQMWDERVPIHLKSDFYDVPGFLAGTSHLRDFEREELGDVRGKSLAHLQCHFGLDTLSWAREGAHVVGLDFSEPAIVAARGLADQLELNAEFVVGDVYRAPDVLGRRFQIVYTGLGAISWLPDLDRWAAVVAGLLEPGGVFYMPEFHPFTEVFADNDFSIRHHYFDQGVPFVDEEGGTYTDPDAETVHNEDYSWTHPVSAVITSLIGAGLHLELFHEHEYTLFRRFEGLEHHPEDRTYRFPESHPRLPLMYSIRMRMNAH